MADNAVPVRVEVTAEGKAAAKELDKVSNAAQAGAEKAATATERASQRAARAEERNARHRARIGIRSEQELQREINRTRIAFKQLSNAGNLTWREQARAADAYRKKITGLTNEMGKLTGRQKLMRGMKFGASLGAGALAAGYTVKGNVERAMSFDRRLSEMTNTAFQERDTAGRIQGMKELEAAINSAVSAGGGTRDEAASALNHLIASGAMTIDESKKMLPEIMKASTATGADAKELAAVGITAMQNFGIGVDEFKNVLNMAAAGGNVGSFEISDMAKWLPKQMAAGKLSGMSGRKGFAEIIALNEIAAITAGSADEAGNNVKDLLLKINNRETAQRAKGLGINLEKELTQGRARGESSIAVFGALLDRVVSKNPRFRELQKQLGDATTDDERRAALESMTQITQGTGIGKLIGDQQALMAAVAYISQKELFGKNAEIIRGNDVATDGVIDKNFAVASSTASYKAEQAWNKKEANEKAALDKMTPLVGRAADAFSALSDKFPGLTGAVTLATPAMLTFATTAGISAAMMGGDKGGVGLIKRMAQFFGVKAGVTTATTVATGATAAGGTTAAGTTAATTAATAGLGVAAAGAAAAVGVVMLPMLMEKMFGKASISAEAMAEAAEQLGVELKLPEAPPVKVETKLKIELPPGVLVRNQSVDVEGGKARVDTGNINTGAPP
jgi:hypothetical protein